MLRFALRLFLVVAAAVLLPHLAAHAHGIALPSNAIELAPADHGPRPLAKPVNATSADDEAAPLRFAGRNLGRQPRAVATALRRMIASSGGRAAVAASACDTPVCAMDAVFGAGVGERLLRLYVDYGFNGSHLGRAGTRAWTADELDAVLAAAADAPLATGGRERLLLRDEKLDRYRSALAITDPAETIVAINGSGEVGLRFGPAWAALPQGQRRAAALHEFAHELARTRGKAEGWSSAWADAALADAFLARRAGLPTSRVSRYAMTNLAEDFAESVVAYRYAPELLRSRAPNRMRFLREVVFRESGAQVAAAIATQSAQAASSM
ncbi:MAG: hypothetical protein INF91_04390 [Alphaproteobacteria bacterium]|nr:hypothetical protein [Alphaproteobacteria bacterium]